MNWLMRMIGLGSRRQGSDLSATVEYEISKRAGGVSFPWVGDAYVKFSDGKTMSLRASTNSTQWGATYAIKKRTRRAIKDYRIKRKPKKWTEKL